MAAPPLPFDDAQQAVLAHADGPLLVTGGPGTGGAGLDPHKRARLIEAGADLIVPDFATHAGLVAYLFRAPGDRLPGVDYCESVSTIDDRR